MGNLEPATIGGVIVAVLTALGTLIGIITKYLKDKRLEQQDNDDKTIARLEARITYLEEQNQILSEKIIQQSNELGYLRGLAHKEPDGQ